MTAAASFTHVRGLWWTTRCPQNCKDQQCITDLDLILLITVFSLSSLPSSVKKHRFAELFTQSQPFKG